MTMDSSFAQLFINRSHITMMLGLVDRSIVSAIDGFFVCVSVDLKEYMHAVATKVHLWSGPETRKSTQWRVARTRIPIGNAA